MMDVHKMSKKQYKRIAKVMGIDTKIIHEVVKDMQEMKILEYVDKNEWRLFDGEKWQPIKL